MSKAYSKLIKDPLTQIRQSIACDFSAKTLDAAQLRGIADRLASIDKAKAGLIATEYKKAADALVTGKAPFPAPCLDNPLAATLWGTALAVQALRHDGKPDRTALWQEIVKQPVIETEKKESAYELYRSFRRIGFKDFKVTLEPPRAGYPAVAYYCDIKGKYVNLDPVWMLLLGVEKARAGMMHEVAHALGSLDFSPPMQKVRAEMEDIKAKGAAMTDEDRVRYLRLDIEWQHRFMTFDEAENSYANRFVITRGASGAEDYGYSLNHVEAVFYGVMKGAGQVSSARKTKPETQDLFINVKRAIRESLFKNNGFFPDTPEGWRLLGVEPEWIKETGGAKGWKALGQLCVLCKKMEDLQPRPAEMLLGADHFTAKNHVFWEQRCAVNDEIYDRFVYPLVEKLQNDAEKKLREQFKKEKEQQQQKKNKQEQNQQPKNGDKKNEEQESGNGAPDMPLPPQTPQEMKRPSSEDQKIPGDNAPTVGDLVDDKEHDGTPEQKEEAQNPAGEEHDQGHGDLPAGDMPENFPPRARKELQPVDLNEYLKLIAPYQHVIRRLEKSLQQLIERQLVHKKAPSPTRSLTPVDGNLARLDTKKLQRSLGNLAAGKTPRLSDFNHYKLDGRKTAAVPDIDIEIIIDISGSLSGRPFEQALLGAIILFEAARRVKGINISITAMGMPTPGAIARPGDTPDEISTRILQLRQAAGGGQDCLSPALCDMLARYGVQKNNMAQATGMSHAVILSDGYFNDKSLATTAAQIFNGLCHQLTMDFLLLDSGHSPEPPEIIATIKSAQGHDAKRISYRRISIDSGAIHEILVDMVDARLKSLKPAEAGTRDDKKKQFKKALQEFKRRTGS